MSARAERFQTSWHGPFPFFTATLSLSSDLYLSTCAVSIVSSLSRGLADRHSPNCKSPPLLKPLVTLLGSFRCLECRDTSGCHRRASRGTLTSRNGEARSLWQHQFQRNDIIAGHLKEILIGPQLPRLCLTAF
ncbi:hypothetical protein BaRGS_00007043 [Batillaria attramentaria]|uniref:Uncharacterized protein n=1 Tax=Batillaria attramentaria TaxID=370345 RepID=A0ABD0LRG9_9CAEN